MTVGSRVTVTVEDRAGAEVADAGFPGVDSKPRWWLEPSQPLFLDELENVGFFHVNVQDEAADLSAVECDQIAVVRLDGEPIGRCVIRAKERRPIARDAAGRYTTLVGLSEFDRLNELVVAPEAGYGRFPFDDTRTFDWTALAFDDSAWLPVVETAREHMGEPDAWPDPVAQWVWWELSETSTLAAIIYMRGTGTAASTGFREVHSASDDRNEIWLQGVHMHRSPDSFYIGNTTVTPDVEISAGSVLVAAKVENVNDAKAGLLLSVLNPFDPADTPVVQSLASSFKYKPDGEPIGMTAGEIFIILRDEAIARGDEVPAITFTKTHDSNGVAWTEYEQLTVNIDARYGQVVLQMVELGMCEFRMSPDAYELNLFNPDTAGAAVEYTTGVTNLDSLTWRETSPRATVMQVRWARGYTSEEDAALVAAHGRRTQGISLAGVASGTRARSLASKVIGRLGRPQLEIGAKVVPEGPESEPYSLYWPGSKFEVPAPGGVSVEKVMAVGLSVDEVGEPVWDVRHNDLLEESGKREQRLLSMYASGGAGGRTWSATPPKPATPVRPREPWTVDWSETTGTIATGLGARKDFSRDVHARGVRLLLEGSISGTYTIHLELNGDMIPGTELSLSAEGRVQGAIAVLILRHPTDFVQPRVTAVGSGATLLTYSLVGA